MPCDFSFLWMNSRGHWGAGGAFPVLLVLPGPGGMLSAHTGQVYTIAGEEMATATKAFTGSR